MRKRRDVQIIFFVDTIKTTDRLETHHSYSSLNPFSFDHYCETFKKKYYV